MKIQMAHVKRISILALICSFIFSVVFLSCESPKADKPAATELPKAKPVEAIYYKLVKTYPHDTTAFTEGFLFHKGQLMESTGDVEYLPQTRSGFGFVNLEKGTIDMKAELSKESYFGEGIVVLNNKIYQLTYQDHVGFIYDATTFKKIGQFNYPGEGWGLTTDGKNIIMSDGTFNLTYLDPNDQKVLKVMAITEAGYGLDHINELEYIKGFIYANVWMTNHIVKIDPETGEVVGKMDLDELGVSARSQKPRSLEMNGIAYDSLTDKILVTGKLWPNIYEISFPH